MNSSYGGNVPVSTGSTREHTWYAVVALLFQASFLLGGTIYSETILSSRCFAVNIPDETYINSRTQLSFSSAGGTPLQLKGRMSVARVGTQTRLLTMASYRAVGINGILNGPGLHFFATNYYVNLSYAPTSTPLYYYFDKSQSSSLTISAGSQIIASPGLGPAFGSGSIMLPTNATNISMSLSANSGGGGFYYNAIYTSVNIYATAQVSLIGPIGIKNAPLQQIPQGLPPSLNPFGNDSQASGSRGLFLQTDGLVNLPDGIFWTSSDPADLYTDEEPTARLLAVTSETRELVYDIIGPKVTHLLLESAVANVVPQLVLQLAGLEIPVMLGQEIDLTAYNPAGFDKFKLRISGIDDWSVLPGDWFLTGYKFASAGNVEVLTRAVLCRKLDLGC